MLTADFTDKFHDNHATLNLDAFDGVFDATATYRVFFNKEPRYIRSLTLKDREIEDASDLYEEADKILSGLNAGGLVEEKDFYRREYQSDKSEVTIMFYGREFVIGVSRFEYQSTSQFSFEACLGYVQYGNETFHNIIKDFEKREGKQIKQHSAKIYVINKTEMGLNLVNFPIRKNTSKDQGIEFEDLYNDDFFEKSERIIQFLGTNAEERDNNGIVVLRGTYGTGKTNYLRHVIRTLNKKIIFLPPELSSELANPGFVTFLMDHPDSVLIIEDAETVLKTRESGGNQAVANLLNMSDGILGDALSLQIVCTLNAESEYMDEALLREGRLVEMYEFNELDEQKTKNLFHKLYGEDATPPKKEMTLSQIFKCPDFERRQAEKPNKVKLGFV